MTSPILHVEATRRIGLIKETRQAKLPHIGSLIESLLVRASGPDSETTQVLSG